VLTALFPDVSSGDTLMGAYRPAQGVQLWRRGTAWQSVGDITDLALARRFMGIWLSPATSQPAMRAALLGLKPV
jgi:Chalcone isomerase-like